MPVAHDKPLGVLIDLIDKRADVLLDLDLQRRGDHPASTLTSERIERRCDLISPLAVSYTHLTLPTTPYV